MYLYYNILMADMSLAMRTFIYRFFRRHVRCQSRKKIINIHTHIATVLISHFYAPTTPRYPKKTPITPPDGGGKKFYDPIFRRNYLQGTLAHRSQDIQFNQPDGIIKKVFIVVNEINNYHDYRRMPSAHAAVNNVFLTPSQNGAQRKINITGQQGNRPFSPLFHNSTFSIKQSFYNK